MVQRYNIDMPEQETPPGFQTATFLPVQEDDPAYAEMLQQYRDILERTGDRRAAWEATGLYSGPATGGAIMREISDAEARWLNDPSQFAGTEQAASDVLYHPELFEAVPQFRDTPVNFQQGMDMSRRGSYQPSTGTVSLNANREPSAQLSTFLHELGGHGVQDTYGLPTGGTGWTAAFARADLESLYPGIEEAASRIQTMRAQMGRLGVLEDALRSREDELRSMGTYDSIAALVERAREEEQSALEQIAELEGRFDPNAMAIIGSTLQQTYEALPGETMARTIQARAHMTPEELRQVYPEDSMDDSAMLTPQFMQTLPSLVEAYPSAGYERYLQVRDGLARESEARASGGLMGLPVTNRRP